MNLNSKQWASLGAFLLVGIVALFVGFIPDIVRAQYCSLRTASVVAIVVNLASFVCFLVQKRQTAKEDRELAKVDVRRDKLIQKILKNEIDEALKRRQTSGRRLSNLHTAYGMYDVLEKARSGPPTLVKVVIEQAIQVALRAMGVYNFRTGTSSTDLDHIDLSNVKNPADLRKVADAFALVVLNEPEHERNNAG